MEKATIAIGDVHGLDLWRDVVLLLGNHDLHYFCEDACVGTRFDMEIAADASKFFLGNIHLFQYAFQDGEYLFTHAGVSQLWFDYDFCGDASRSVAEQLNNPAADQMPALLRVGYVRGGRRGDTGGIFWADKSELEDPLHGFTQIVGHNRVAEVTEHTGPGGGKIVFCDCLRNGLYLYL